MRLRGILRDQSRSKALRDAITQKWTQQFPFSLRAVRLATVQLSSDSGHDRPMPQYLLLEQAESFSWFSYLATERKQ